MGDRIEWIDFAKGIGIICVILGHMVLIPEKLKIIICSFHMPLFFFLAGITFNAKKYDSLKLLIKDKIKKIVIPYILFAIIYYFYDVLYLSKNYNSVSFLVKRFLGIIINIRNTTYAGGIWFLTCIFGVYIILYFIAKNKQEKAWKKCILAFILFVIGYLCSFFKVRNLPWALDVWFMASFFAVIGMYMADKIKNTPQKTKGYISLTIVLLIFMSIVSIYCYKYNKTLIDMYSKSYENPILFLIQTFLGIAAIIFLSRIFDKKNIISIIGKDSMYYYGLHNIIISTINKNCYQYKFNWIVNILLCFISLIFCIFILKKIKIYYDKIYEKILFIGGKQVITKNEQ